MLYNLRNPVEVEKFNAKVSTLLKKAERLQDYNPDGKTCIVELIEKQQSRSLAQNAYYHVILAYFASEYGISKEQAECDFFKRHCNSDIFVRKTVNKKGREVEYLRSSADLDKEEMSLAITRFRNWSSAEAEIYIPSGEEHEYIVFCQQAIERNKEYLYG